MILVAVQSELLRWARKRASHGTYALMVDLAVQARIGVHMVVTRAVPSVSVHKIKSPDSCIGLGIKCMTPYEMLRCERVRILLGAAS